MKYNDRRFSTDTEELAWEFCFHFLQIIFDYFISHDFIVAFCTVNTRIESSERNAGESFFQFFFSSQLPFLSIFFLFQSFFSFSHPFFFLFCSLSIFFLSISVPSFLLKDIRLKYSIIIYISILKNVCFQILGFQTLLIKKQFHILLVSCARPKRLIQWICSSLCA